MRVLGVDPEIITRLESEASRNPRAYRLRLALIAVAGDFALTITQLAPWAAPIAIGALWVNSRTFYLLTAAATVFLAWMLRPSWRFEGHELNPGDAPELQAEIERLKDKLRAPGRMRVFIDASFNASAAETRGLFGVFGTQCVLTLGVPLLLALSREHVLAVIAHEFGHFSRRHGRLGQWLYRARVGWIQYAQSVGDSDSAFDRAAAWYARRFVPFFSTRSFVHSRQCEYEADADAALAVGSRIFADALARTAVFARLWTEHLPRRIRDWQLQSSEAPVDFYERFAQLVRDCRPVDAQAWLREALKEPSGWLDTHPSLSERLGALKQEPRLADASESAASALLGTSWPGALAEFNRRWEAEARPVWRLEHLRLKHLVEPLLASSEETMRSWTDEQRLARARARLGLDPAPALAELRMLHTARPDHKRTKFAYAAALLGQDDEAGVALMEALARADPAFRVQAFRRVLAYHERKEDARQTERWSAWLNRATQNFASAASACLADVESGRLEPAGSSVANRERTVLMESVRFDSCIRNAWLFEAKAQLHFSEDKAPIAIVLHVLGLAIDPDVATRLQQDEEAVVDRYERLLEAILPPDQASAVRTFFTTEEIPAVYTPALRLWPASNP